MDIRLVGYRVDMGPSREALLALQTEVLKHPQADLPVNHHFAEGVYVRELPMPAGAIIVGKLHRQSHISMLTKGEVTIVTERERRRVRAPYLEHSPVGAKRAFYAHEDSVWVTCHGTHETDAETLEAQLIAPDYETLEAELRGLLCRS